MSGYSARPAPPRASLRVTMNPITVAGARLIRALLLLVAATAATATTPPPRERVKFDFAWRHALVTGPPPPPPPPPLPPVGPSHCPFPDHWPANKSGVQCSGLAEDQKAKSAAACAVNCCNDQSCSVWQFSNATSGGGCWRGACSSFGHNNSWVGGIRPVRVNPLPPAPVPRRFPHQRINRRRRRPASTTRTGLPWISHTT